MVVAARDRSGVEGIMDLDPPELQEVRIRGVDAPNTVLAHQHDRGDVEEELALGRVRAPNTVSRIAQCSSVVRSTWTFSASRSGPTNDRASRHERGCGKTFGCVATRRNS
jgi:hypothetical protein